MATWPASAGFAERHTATMGLMQALNIYLELPREELSRTAGEIEESCLKQSTSKEHYLSLIREKKDAISKKPAGAKADSNGIAVTTGVSYEAGAEKQVVSKYEAIFHQRSLNAVVYRARDPASAPDTWFALKIVSLAGQVAPHDIRREATFLRRLSSSQSSSSSSPSSAAVIIPLLGAEPLAGGLFALKLPFRRHDLGSLAAQGLLSAAAARAYLVDVFRALAAVHAAGIVHRDVKPANVLLLLGDEGEGEEGKGRGRAQLIDFGIAWAADVDGDVGEREPADGKITDVGTGAYRAPELLFGCRDYGAELDMWAAGCTAAEVLAGGGRALFDAGVVTREDFLGSDLTLVNSIFRKLGTPTDETWPETRTFRDWGKIQFKEYPALSWQEMLPDVDPSARDLVGSLVKYSGSKRVSAEQILHHEYFQASKN